MSYCEKIKTDQVVCDEIFFFEHEEDNIPVNFIDELPPESELTGTVLVTVLECEVVAEEFFTVEVTFLLQKELEIVTPEQQIIPLEFVERFQEEAAFRKCFPTDLELLDIDLDQLYCHVVHTEAEDVFNLDTAAGTFDENLTIELKLKLLAKVQEVVKRCPRDQTVVLEVNQQQ